MNEGSPKSSPLVSIGMPFHNSEKTLEHAVRSILWQSFEDWELLLCDDGSTDKSLEIARSFNDERIVVWSDGKNRKLASRLNECMVRARGKYFARMDADDISYPERLEKQVQFIEADSSIDLLGTSVIVIDAFGKAIGARRAPGIHDAICSRPASGFGMCHPTYFGKVSWFREHRYDPSLPKSQDQDLLLRSYAGSNFANLEEILLAYRDEKIDLKKIFESRKAWGKSMWRHFRAEGKPLLSLKAVILQASRFIVESIAVGTGMERGILSHRAQPCTENEVEKWNAIYQKLIDE